MDVTTNPQPEPSGTAPPRSVTSDPESGWMSFLTFLSEVAARKIYAGKITPVVFISCLLKVTHFSGFVYHFRSCRMREYITY